MTADKKGTAAHHIGVSTITFWWHIVPLHLSMVPVAAVLQLLLDCRHFRETFIGLVCCVVSTTFENYISMKNYIIVISQGSVLEPPTDLKKMVSKENNGKKV